MILSQQRKRVTCSRDIANILKAILHTEHEVDQNKEHLWSIGLNNKNVVQYVELVTLGILNSSLAHPREIFRLAIMKGIKSIIIAHNHPSDDLEKTIPEPSREDNTLTQRIAECSKILGIDLLDSIIINNHGDGVYSYKDQGLL